MLGRELWKWKQSHILMPSGIALTSNYSYEHVNVDSRSPCWALASTFRLSIQLDVSIIYTTTQNNCHYHFERTIDPSKRQPTQIAAYFELHAWQ